MNMLNTQNNVLSFDLEDWFHLLDVTDLEDDNRWHSFERRFEYSMERILDITSENNTTATCFVLGWIADEYPSMIRKLSRLGFDIGTHSDKHRLVSSLSPSEFRSDLKGSLDKLGRLVSEPVVSFRAPGFSITEKQSWAFEVLYEEGIRHDASVFLGSHAHGGIKIDDICSPFLLHSRGIELKEFPLVPGNFLNIKVFFSGGGYFRLLPYWLIRVLQRRNHYNMFYFHPRDFDYDQPRIRLSTARNFRSYVGLKHSIKKFEKLVRQSNMKSISDIARDTDWTSCKTVEID